ncbi:hypothetical protein FM120_29980 [Sphingobacterium faecium PCAi_F2.5]|nr:hypothetical protein FM120_29980 [Sphingobacterium faecium PCAi_F2.5]
MICNRRWEYLCFIMDIKEAEMCGHRSASLIWIISFFISAAYV